MIYEKYQNESVSVEFIDKKTVSYIKIFLAQKTHIPPFSILKKRDIDIFEITDKIYSNSINGLNEAIAFYLNNYIQKKMKNSPPLYNQKIVIIYQ